MNLVHLHRKKDPVLQIGEAVAAARVSAGDRTYDGFVLPAGPAGALRLRSALRWHPLSSRPLTTDWLAVAPVETPVEVTLADETGAVVSRVVDTVGPTPAPLSLPPLRGPSKLIRDQSLDLVVTNISSPGQPVTLLVAEVDSDRDFLALATGVGAVILSGRPGILPDAGRDVFYVGSAEQIAAALPPRDPAAPGWSEALLGDSHDIPLVDGGLDFLFAGQILHRAVNPLGHLALWRNKLKPGGRVLGVAPYVAGGGDYLNSPTSMTDWLRQFETGGFVETQAHHNAFAQARDLNPKSLFRRNYPSAFSFFTPANVVEALTFGVSRLGYSGYHIEHVRNGRDIRFGLYA